MNDIQDIQLTNDTFTYYKKLENLKNIVKNIYIEEIIKQFETNLKENKGFLEIKNNNSNNKRLFYKFKLDIRYIENFMDKFSEKIYPHDIVKEYIYRTVINVFTEWLLIKIKSDENIVSLVDNLKDLDANYNVENFLLFNTFSIMKLKDDSYYLEFLLI